MMSSWTSNNLFNVKNILRTKSRDRKFFKNQIINFFYIQYQENSI